MNNVVNFPSMGLHQAREIVEHPDLFEAVQIRTACETLIKIGTSADFRAVQELHRARIIDRFDLLDEKLVRHERFVRCLALVIVVSALVFWTFVLALLLKAFFL